MGPLDVDPDEARRSRWARAWRLPARFARVAVHVMHGLTDKEIAAETGLSVLTVRTYVKGIYRAAGVHNRVELVRRALAVSRRR
jgi:DNA-binding NarL/FixJ family response regulator